MQAFTTISASRHARHGRLETGHGTIETPNFMPVATRGVFHGMEIDDARKIGVEIIMSNTFHLANEVGADRIAAAGGLHDWMKWDQALATDSGGFQVFSYGWSRVHGVKKIAGGINAPIEDSSAVRSSQATIDDEGVSFIDRGGVRRFTPEDSIRLQEQLGADLVFSFDEPSSPLHDFAYNQVAMDRTHRWAKRCLAAHRRSDQILMGIVQGGTFRELREESARIIGALPFGGFAIGGSYAAGAAADAVSWARPYLDPGRVRHVLGIGWIGDIVRCVDAGADLFDCVEPIRRARHQHALSNGRYLDVRKIARAQPTERLDPACQCPTCVKFTRAELLEWCRQRDWRGSRALAVHNVAQMIRLMQDIRVAIDENRWAEKRSEILRMVS